jgi:hypothetical protein
MKLTKFSGSFSCKYSSRILLQYRFSQFEAFTSISSPLTLNLDEISDSLGLSSFVLGPQKFCCRNFKSDAMDVVSKISELYSFRQSEWKSMFVIFWQTFLSITSSHLAASRACKLFGIFSRKFSIQLMLRLNYNFS